MKSLITRLTPLALAASLLMPALPVYAASSSQQFNDLADLSADMKAKLDALIAAGIFNGTSEDTFSLDQNMTRSQLAIVLARAFNLQTTAPVADPSFKDIPATNYASSYIEAVKQAGLMNGVGNGVFEPSNNVTREQLATVLVRSLAAQPDNGAVVGGEVSDWAKGYVSLALQMKLLEASNDYANQNATREDLANGIFGALQQYSEKDKLSLLVGKQRGAKSLYVNFNQHTEPSTVSFSVTMNGAVVEASAKPDALNGYILSFPDNLKEGTYSIKASSSQTEMNSSSVQVKVQEEKPAAIQFAGSSDTLPQAAEVIIPYQVKNQFGEAMSYPVSELRLLSTESSAVMSSDLQAVVMSTLKYISNQMAIFVDISLKQFPEISVRKTFKVGAASLASQVEKVTLRNNSGAVVSSLIQGQSYHLNFQVLDQYGTPFPAAALASAKIDTSVSNPDILTAGTLQAAASGEDGNFSIPLTVRYPEKDTNVVVTLKTANGGSLNVTLPIAGVPRPVTTPQPPVVTPESPRLTAVTHEAVAGEDVFATSNQNGVIYLLHGAPEQATPTAEVIMERSSTEGGPAEPAQAGQPVVLSTEGLEPGDYVMYAVNPENGLVSEPEIIKLTLDQDDTVPVLSGVTDTSFMYSESKELKATSSKDGFIYLVQTSISVLGPPTLEMLDLYSNESASGIKVEVSANEGATITVEGERLLPGPYTFYAVDENGNISAPAGTITVFV